MTLRRRLIVHVTLLAVGATLLAGGVVIGMNGLRQDFGVALQANGRLRPVYEVGLHVASAKRWLREQPQNVGRARDELRMAVLKLEGRGDGAGAPDPSIARIRVLVDDAVAQLGQASRGAADQPIDDATEVPALDQSLAAIAALSA